MDNKVVMDNEVNKVMGSVLLVSYNDSQFTKYCKESNAFVLDIRKTGWSSNPALSSAYLAKTLGARYKLMPELCYNIDETVSEYNCRIEPYAQKVVAAIQAGCSVIITGFNTHQLKMIGQMVLTYENDARIYLKWENQDGESGMSLQRRLKGEALKELGLKLKNSMNGFIANATKVKAVDANKFF